MIYIFSGTKYQALKWMRENKLTTAEARYIDFPDRLYEIQRGLSFVRVWTARKLSTRWQRDMRWKCHLTLT